MTARNKLARSAPEAQGVPSQAVSAFLDALEHSNLEMHSLMLLRHGAVIAEGWWAPFGPDIPHMLYSLSKSFTSTAVGIAVAEGRLSVDDFVLSFFPDEAPADPSPNLKAMRVRHLLSMSAGHDQDPSMQVFANRNWVKAFLAQPVEHEPGTHFCYNTAATYMLSAILQKVTGEKLIRYLRPRLFEPLGIKGAAWESCPMGINTGGFGLSVKTEDIARFGQLYLNKGLWNGKRLVAEEWVEQASSKQISNGDDPNSDWAQGYGYQFWRCRHNIFRGDGAFGQYCIVMPDQDAVLAITSAVEDMQVVLNHVWDCLLPAMTPEALAPNPQAAEELAKRLAGLRIDPPAGEGHSPTAAKVTGRKIVFEPNEAGLVSGRFDFTPQGAQFTLQKGRKRETIECGQGEWAFGVSSLLDGWSARVARKPAKVAASGVWTAPDVFQITARFYETPHYLTIKSRFSEDGVQIETKVNLNLGPLDWPTLTGRFE
ncbi:MAG: serine hydrolase [Chloroflexi bacterium]|nr:serine hydrolase [Chloroflexota bacterium]